MEDVPRRKRNIETRLANPQQTAIIYNLLLDKSQPVEEKLRRLNAMRKDEISAEEFQTAIGAISYTPEARMFTRCLLEEVNRTPRYGENRSVDERDEGTQNPFASKDVKGCLSARAAIAIDTYARAIAAYLGAKQVGIEHVQAIAPHCLAHRLAFTDDYMAHDTDRVRLLGEHKELDLTRRMLGEIKQRYDAIAGPLNALDQVLQSYQSPKHAQQSDALAREQATQILKNTVRPDHPVLRIYYDEMRSDPALHKQLGI